MILIRIYLSRCCRSLPKGRAGRVGALHEDPMLLSTRPTLDNDCARRVPHLAVDVLDLIQHLLVHRGVHHTVLLLW